MNPPVLLALWLLSRKVRRLAKKRNVEDSFLFVHPDGGQLAQIGELLKAGVIRPVIDKVYPLESFQFQVVRRGSGRLRLDT